MQPKKDSVPVILKNLLENESGVEPFSLLFLKPLSRLFPERLPFENINLSGSVLSKYNHIMEIPESINFETSKPPAHHPFFPRSVVCAEFACNYAIIINMIRDPTSWKIDGNVMIVR